MKKLLFIPFLIIFNLCFSQSKIIIRSATQFDASAITSGKFDTARIPYSGTPAEYTCNTDGTTITATPRAGSGLTPYSGTDAYTVIQDAINALTPTGGGSGSGGGKIHINSGVYQLTNELKIIGWEGAGYSSDGPYSNLIIEGDGFSTQISQNTSGKNGIVISNAAGVILRNFRMINGSSAKSCILGDTTGTDQEASMYRSEFDHLFLFNNTANYPALYLRDFIACSFGYLQVYNIGGTAMILENASATQGLAYGNSDFKYLELHGNQSKTYPSADLLMQTAPGSTVFMNLNTFSNVECSHGYYGIHLKNTTDNKFNFCDVEGLPVDVFCDSGASYNNFSGGYLFPIAGDTAIEINSGTAYSINGNTFSDIYLETPNGTQAIYDNSNFNRPDLFRDLIFTGSAPGIKITNSTNTYLSYRTLGSFATWQPANQTTVSGSTSGSAIFSQPWQGGGYKKVMVYCNALNGTATYTYPTAFTKTPVVTFATTGITASSITTTAVTASASTVTGFMIIEGY